VIEDDIVVSSDIIKFMSECLKSFGQESRFRGVMAYSIINSTHFSKGDVVKVNFGIGFGWLITDAIYRDLLEFWTGNEHTHWDYWIEPYLRTGFIVAPIYSRVRNIGFDATASHSSELSKFGHMMDESFIIAQSKEDSKVKEVSISYSHSRSDCCLISSLGFFERKELYALRDLSFILYKWAIRNKPRVHYLWRLIRNYTDVKFSNIHVVDQYFH
jgi:GR25 family glycosyltransferase involved in LPS biosynthesis